MRPEGLPSHRRPLGRRVQRHQCRQRRRSQTSPSTTRNKASNTGRRGLSVRKPRQTCTRTSCAWFVRRQMPCAKEPLLRSASSSSVVEMSPTAPARGVLPEPRPDKLPGTRHRGPDGWALASAKSRCGG